MKKIIILSFVYFYALLAFPVDEFICADDKCSFTYQADNLAAETYGIIQNMALRGDVSSVEALNAIESSIDRKEIAFYNQKVDLSVTFFGGRLLSGELFFDLVFITDQSDFCASKVIDWQFKIRDFKSTHLAAFKKIIILLIEREMEQRKKDANFLDNLNEGLESLKEEIVCHE